MEALVKEQPGPGMTLKSVPTPSLGPNDVLIRTKAVGIDGGVEQAAYDWKEESFFVQALEEKLPRILGHEYSGVIDAVGAEVTRWSRGQRVVVEPGASCRDCVYCRSGREHLCPNKVGTLDRDGALAEYVAVPEDCVYAFDGLSFDEASYVEVLGVGVAALERSQFSLGDTVAISGPGPVGFSALIAAVNAGADSVYMLGIDIDEGHRLPTAERMGATAAINILSEDVPEKVDVFFEVSGNQSALDTAVETTHRGGQLVQIGLFGRPVELDLDRLTFEGITLQPSLGRSVTTWATAIDLAKAVDLSPIIGPNFSLRDYEAAFDAARNREGVKVIINP